MNLRLHASLHRGTSAFEFDLEVPNDRTVALVGPNGAGKSTLLQTVAGLLRIDRGRILFDDEVWDGGPSGVFVPPERRGTGFVFQDHLLFPHLDALQNVAFGPRARGASRADAESEARTWLERVGLLDRAKAKPRELSGGQAQRVALARALASRPRVLLLDEPLAAVDASLRTSLRRELREHLDAFQGPRIVVTHDVGDAFALASEVAVLEGGRIVQRGSVAEICAAPRSRYVADLVGVNWLAGECRDGVFSVRGGGELRVAYPGTGAVLASVHPRAISLFRERPSGSPRNVFEATVAAVEPALDGLRVRLDGPVPLVAEITEGARRELQLAPGARVWLALKATEIAVAPA